MVRLLGELACGPQTGLEEINGNLLEADFGTTSGASFRCGWLFNSR
jgi:hypothetical protein